MTSEEEKQKELRKKIEYQVACEERAFRIVERLIENPVEQQFLCDALQFITPNHYSDIVEERAVSKLCGYPVCGKTLSNVPKQRYAISTKTNKVYDIEARKNFCSGKCYKASLYLEKQISTSPVWSRQKQPPVKFELMPLDSKSGCIGDEIILSQREELQKDVAKLEKLDKYQEALKEEQLKVKSSSHAHEDKHHKEENRTSAEVTSDIGPFPYDRKSDLNAVNDKNDECVYTLERALGEMEMGSESQDFNTEFKETRKEDSYAGNEKNEQDTMLSKVSTESRKLVKETDSEKDSELPGKSSKPGLDTGTSKTEYLMKLLDKRKSLLAKMADIQPLSVLGEQTSKQPIVENKICDKALDTDKVPKPVHKEKASLLMLNEDTVPGGGEISGQVAFTKHFESSETDSTLTRAENETGVKGDKVIVNQESDGIENNTDNCINTKFRLDNSKETPTVMKKTTLVQKEQMNTSIPSKFGSERQIVSILALVCNTIQAWITVESLEYLKEPLEQIDHPKSEFERQYRALERKIDKQERDFENMLGEEMMTDEDPTERPSRPLPHFEVLKEEAEQENVRVREFMKGSFTYKVEERETAKAGDRSHEIILPSVDRYDQLLIRQRIVLDRISKVLPDLLKPLHLLIQHVFTELRELVFTFKLTKDNILFKPAEWSLVSLVLLKLISCRSSTVRAGFDSSEAMKCFSIVLKGAGSSLEELEKWVLKLKQTHTQR